MKFMCWESEVEEEDDAEEVSAGSAEFAATNYIERRWSDFDSPETSTVSVRDADGRISQWIVTAEPSVEFRARPPKDLR